MGYKEPEAEWLEHSDHSVEIMVHNSYDIKDTLKDIGYKFNPGDKCWFKLIRGRNALKDLDTELSHLQSFGVKVL